MSRIRLRHTELPKSLTGWVCVNDLGVPRLWATVWADILLSGLAETTRGSHLAAVEKLYRSAAELAGGDCLDRVIATLDFDELEAVLGGFLAKLRNDSAIEGIDRERTWQTALRFVSDIVNHIGRADGAAFAEVHARLLRLNVLYGQLAPKASRPPAPIRALPAVVVEDLYDIFSPRSARNPFRSESARWRNYLIFLLMLHMGLRRSEVLVLPADAVKDDFDPATCEVLYWVDIVRNPYSEGDPRSQPPGIKTKSSRRQLPLPEELVRLTDLYVQNYRGKPAHSFLFNSQKQAPLAVQTVDDIFTSVSARLSPQARKALSDRGIRGVNCHDLRHTAAVVRLTRYMELGNDLDTATGKLRRFFGWSLDSKMPRHYAAAYFETHLAEVWNESFDCFAESLRDLAGDEWLDDFGGVAS